MRKPEWWSGSPPITDPKIIENAQKAARRKVEIGRLPRKIGTWTARIGTPLVLTLAGGAFYADSHPEETSELLTNVLGRDNALKIEAQYFTAKDKLTKFEYQIGLVQPENPFSTSDASVSVPTPQAQAILPEVEITTTPTPFVELPVIEVPPPPPKKPAPFIPPKVELILPKPQPGEGEWTTAGLPNPDPESPLMEKTFISPDVSRPYANVAVLMIDSRRIKLNMVGGAAEPAAGGPGEIPEEDKSSVIATWNGGFKSGDNKGGMYANGKLYKPLVKGFATVVSYADGSIKIGNWGEEDLVEKTDDMIAIRQNVSLLVRYGEITPAALNRESDNNIWGAVNYNSSEFVTWRSAIGISDNGYFMIAAGNNLTARTLAMAMKEAGARYAMQLDINAPYLLISTYNNGEFISLRTDFSVKNPRKYIDGKGLERDFMYLTFDESRFTPKIP